MKTPLFFFMPPKTLILQRIPVESKVYDLKIMALIKCKECGNLISENATACPKCGHPTNDEISPRPNYMVNNYASNKSKTTAGILALLLGGIGIHYVYCGKALPGFVFLLLFWTGIPAILAFVQAIMMFTMTQEQFYYKYVNTPSSFPLF